MKIEMEAISNEIVKPSFPSSTIHPHHYHLSFLDQKTPRIFNSLVLFYEPDDDNIKHLDIHEISDKLKTSLSQVLRHFYPLAGRDDGDLLIICNDDGIPFIQTQVECKLSDFIHNPNPNQLKEFIPFKVDEKTDLLMGIQLNVFQCGGIAIGINISHKISDALSLFTVIRTWAAIARGDLDDEEASKFCSHMESAKLFPSRDLGGHNPGSGFNKADVVQTKRFVFNASEIEHLRKKYTQGLSCWENQRPPSRVETLTAFIWNRCFAATAIDSSSEGEKLHFVFHMVNIRQKIDPPLPDYAFGNYIAAATTTLPISDKDDIDDKAVGYTLIKKVREGMAKIDLNFVKEMQENSVEHMLSMRKTIKELMKEDTVMFTFSSLCRMPIYDADFGWGKPTWVGPPARPFKNSVVFLDTKTGGGIEAYISLLDEGMEKLESDEEFRRFSHA